MGLRLSTIIAAAIAVAAGAAAADARPPHREQDGALRSLREGRILPLPVIEQMVMPRMPGFRYLGPELDLGSGRYRLKFMRGPRVVWVDVDGRTGNILGLSD